MKKIIITIFAAIGVLSLLMGCNGSGSDAGSNNNVGPIVLEPKPDTNGSVQTLNADVNTHSLPTVAKIKFNDAGDAMAIWSEQTGIGIIANFSFKLASASQWSVPKIVYEQHDSQSTQYSSKIKFETDGSDFVISWIDGDFVYARTFLPGTETLWTQKIVLNDNQLNNPTVFPNVQIASTNGSILVVWFQDNLLYGKEFKLSEWQVTAELIFDLDTLLPTKPISSIDEFYLNGSNNQYSLFGHFGSRDNLAGDYQEQVFSLIRGVIDPAVWGNAKILNSPNIVGKVRAAKVLGTNSGFLYSWIQQDMVNSGEFHLYSSEMIVVNNTESWTTTYQVDNDTATRLFPNISVAINSTGYGYVWDEVNKLDFTKQQISFRLYDKNLKLWSQPVVQSATDQRYRYSQITGVDSQYVVAWTAERDLLVKTVSLTDVSVTAVKINVPGRTDQIFSLVSDQSRAVVFWNLLNFDGTTTRYASSSSDLLQWDAINLHADINFADDFYAPSYNVDEMITSTTFYNGQVWSSWLGTTMTDSKTVTRNYVDVYETDWQTFDFPDGIKSKTSGQMPKLITNAAGEMLNIWHQYHDGRFWIYASIREQGIWGEPVALMPARETFGGHLSPRTLDYYKLATVRDKFIITWRAGSKDKLVKEYDGSKWLTTVELETGKNSFDTNVLYAPIAFTENDQYRIFWIENNIDNNTFDIFEASQSNNKWLVTNLLSLSDPEPFIGSIANFSMAQSADNSYLVSFTRTGETLTVANVYAQIFKNKQWLTDRQKISADIGNASNRLKSVGFGEGNFALVWQEMPLDFSIPGRGIYSSVYDGQSTKTWLPVKMVSESVNLLNIAANDSTVAVGVGGSSLEFHIYDLISDSWPASQSMQYATLVGSPASSLLGSGDSFVASWSGERLFSNIIPVVRFENLQWSSVPAELIQAETNSELFQPYLTVYRHEYAISWAQVDLLNSPSLSIIKTKVGGF